MFFGSTDEPNDGTELLLTLGDLVVILPPELAVRETLRANSFESRAPWYVGAFRKFHRNHETVSHVTMHLFGTGANLDKVIDKRPQRPLYRKRMRRRGDTTPDVIPYPSRGYEDWEVRVAIDTVLPVANVQLTSAKVLRSKVLKRIATVLQARRSATVTGR